MTEKSALLILTERVIELDDYIKEICNIIYMQLPLKEQDWWVAKMIDAGIYVVEEEEWQGIKSVDAVDGLVISVWCATHVLERNNILQVRKNEG